VKGDLHFASDQQESEDNHLNATSSPKSPSSYHEPRVQCSFDKRINPKETLDIYAVHPAPFFL